MDHVNYVFILSISAPKFPRPSEILASSWVTLLAIISFKGFLYQISHPRFILSIHSFIRQLDGTSWVRQSVKWPRNREMKIQVSLLPRVHFLLRRLTLKWKEVEPLMIEECIGYKEAQRRGGLTLPEGGCLDAHHSTPQRHWGWAWMWHPTWGKQPFSALGFLSHIPHLRGSYPSGPWPFSSTLGHYHSQLWSLFSWGWPKLQTPTQTPILGMSSGSFLPKCIVFLPTFLCPLTKAYKVKPLGLRSHSCLITKSQARTQVESSWKEVLSELPARGFIFLTNCLLTRRGKPQSILSQFFCFVFLCFCFSFQPRPIQGWVRVVLSKWQQPHQGACQGLSTNTKLELLITHSLHV